METKTNINPRVNTLNPARRFTVRLSLAAGATVATLLGSQALASLERSAAAKTVTPDAGNTDNGNTALVVTVAVTAEPSITPLPPGADPAKVSTLPPAAPQLVVIRNPGALPAGVSQSPIPAKAQPGASSAQPNAGAIVPPRPVVVPAEPVAVQQPAPVVGAPAQPAQPAPAQAAPPRPAPAQPAPRTSSSRK